MTATTKPGDHFARARRSAIETIRRNLGDFIGPRTKPTPDTQDLLAGMEFPDGSAAADMDRQVRFWLDERCPHKLPAALIRPLERLHEYPSAKTARALRRAILRVETAVEADETRVLFATRQELKQLAVRCDVWGAEWGDPEAALRCASQCFDAWRYTANGYAWASLQGWGLLRQWIVYSEDALRPPSEGFPPPPGERADDLTAILPVLRELHQTLDVILEAIDAGPFEEEPSKAIVDDTDQVAAQMLDDDRAGIARTGDPAADPLRSTVTDEWLEGLKKASLEGPSLLVLASAEHLPKNGGSGRADARKDADQIAAKRIPLQGFDDLSAVRAELDAEFPHLSAITNRILTTQVGREWIKLPNVVLLGAPGIAKTRYARRIGEALGLKPVVHPSSGLPDGMFAGLSRGWSNGMPCAPLQAIIQSKIANPLLVMDEIEKIGTSRSYGSLHDVLLNLLEAESATRYNDPYFSCAVNISAVNFIMTANSLAGIGRPLLDRCVVLTVPAPGPEHLDVLAGSILDDLREERGQDEAWCPDLDPVELDALRAHWPGGSLRALRQLVAAVLDARDATAPRQ